MRHLDDLKLKTSFPSELKVHHVTVAVTVVHVNCIGTCIRHYYTEQHVVRTTWFCFIFCYYTYELVLPTISFKHTCGLLVLVKSNSVFLELNFCLWMYCYMFSLLAICFVEQICWSVSLRPSYFSSEKPVCLLNMLLSVLMPIGSFLL